MNVRKLGTGFLLAAIVVGVNGATIAQWKLGAAKNNQVKDSIGKHNGTIEGCKDQAGFIDKRNKAASFSGKKEQVAIKHHKSLNLENNFSIECEVKPELVDIYRTILWKGDRTQKPEQINYYVCIHKGRVEFKYKDEAGKWYVYATKASLIKPDQWVKLQITFNDGDVAMSVNGESVKVNSPFGAKRKKITSLTTNKGNLYLGCGASASGKAYPFKGLIKEVKISSL